MAYKSKEIKSEASMGILMTDFLGMFGVEYATAGKDYAEWICEKLVDELDFDWDLEQTLQEQYSNEQ